eukprot:172836_1
MDDRIKDVHSKYQSDEKSTEPHAQNGAEVDAPSIINKELIKRLTETAPLTTTHSVALKDYSSNTDPLFDMVSVENLRYILFELIKSHNAADDTVTDFEIRKILRKWKDKLTDLYLSLLDSYGQKDTIEQIEMDKALKTYRLTDGYRLGKKLGRGAYAVVKLAERKSDKMRFAAKIINKRGLNKWDLRGLRLEIAIMRDLEHANIVRLFDVFESPSKIGLIIGLLRGGELLDVVIDKGSFSEHEASQCFAQLCDGLAYIHSANIAHRDVKPDNLLFATKIDDWSNIPKDSLKLVDFGLAERCRKNKGLTEYCGTPIYMAPEIYDHKPYNYACDMWAAGCILYALLVGYPPFDFDEDHDINQLSHSVRKDPIDFDPEFWSEIGRDAKDLIIKLLERDPHKRYTADQALRHPWMKSASKKLFDQRRMDRLKLFQHIRKMKRGVHAMIAVIRLIEILEEAELLEQQQKEDTADNVKGNEIEDDEVQPPQKSMEDPTDIQEQVSANIEQSDEILTDEVEQKTEDKEEQPQPQTTRAQTMTESGRADSFLNTADMGDDSDGSDDPAPIKVKGDDDSEEE